MLLLALVWNHLTKSLIILTTNSQVDSDDWGQFNAFQGDYTAVALRFGALALWPGTNSANGRSQGVGAWLWLKAVPNTVQVVLVLKCSTLVLHNVRQQVCIFFALVLLLFHSLPGCPRRKRGSTDCTRRRLFSVPVPVPRNNGGDTRSTGAAKHSWFEGYGVRVSLVFFIVFIVSLFPNCEIPNCEILCFKCAFF